MKNKFLWITLGVIAVFFLIVIFSIIGSYNRFVTLEQDINGKWSEVENQYQRQADLIPNLVSVVASSTKVETQFVTQVTEARSQWQTAQSQLEKDTAGVQMNNGVTALVNAIAISEDYPVLQANTQYVTLTDELSGTQNRITVARGRYIESIQSYNTAVKRFPANMIAGMFGFNSKEYYTADIDSLTTTPLGSGNLP